MRRTKDPTSSAEQAQEAPGSRQKLFSDAQRVFGAEGPDTSYEAALRAADALFSPPAGGKAMPPSAQPEPDSWSSQPESPPAAGAQSAGFQAADGGGAPRADVAEKNAPAHGRILQAIEAPGEDRFAALEAERAPKRRGRKPGSKNKPKLSRGDDWLGAAAAAAQPVIGAPTPVQTTGAAVSELVDTVDETLGFDEDGAAIPDETGEAPTLTGRSRNDRFGWKRAGLRPGERWKRRLPKVAW